MIEVRNGLELLRVIIRNLLLPGVGDKRMTKSCPQGRTTLDENSVGGRT